MSIFASEQAPLRHHFVTRNPEEGKTKCWRTMVYCRYPPQLLEIPHLLDSNKSLVYLTVNRCSRGLRTSTIYI